MALKVHPERDLGIYLAKDIVSDAEMRYITLLQHPSHGEWNY